MVWMSLANSSGRQKPRLTLPSDWSAAASGILLGEEPLLDSLTFHEGCVGAAVVVKVSAVRVVQAVISQAVCVAETLKDAVHEALEGTHAAQLHQLQQEIIQNNQLHTFSSGESD